MAKGLIGFLKAECACFMQGDKCLGVDVFNRVFNTSGHCCILRNKPCRYFEQAVLPAAKTKHPGDFETILRGYFKVNKNFNQDAIESGRRCGCGELLFKRQRYCPGCAKKNRKASYRESKRKSRSRCPQLTKNAIS